MKLGYWCSWAVWRASVLWQGIVRRRRILVHLKLIFSRRKYCVTFYFDVEYIYGFVWWGVCKQSRWRHSVTEPSEDSGYVLIWQRYDNNKMVAMRYYGNVSFCCWRCVYELVTDVLYIFNSTVIDWTCFFLFCAISSSAEECLVKCLTK